MPRCADCFADFEVRDDDGADGRPVALRHSEKTRKIERGDRSEAGLGGQLQALAIFTRKKR